MPWTDWKPPVSKHVSKSQKIRELMPSHPLPDIHNPVSVKAVKLGINTAALHVEGPLVYATQTTAAWLWRELVDGTFWHDMNTEHGHMVAFLASDLPTVVRTLLLAGRQVLIV